MWGWAGAGDCAGESCKYFASFAQLLTVQLRPLRAAPLLLLRPQGDDCRVPPGAAVLQTVHHCRGMPGLGGVCDVLLTAVTRRATPAAAWRWRVAAAGCGDAPGGWYQQYYLVL